MATSPVGTLVCDAFADLASGRGAERTLERVLGHLLALTGSELGFIAALRSAAAEGSADVETFVAVRADGAPSELSLSACAAWIAATCERGGLVIANDLAAAADGPKGERRFSSFCGVPLTLGTAQVGVLGLANRAGGYVAAAVGALDSSFLATAFVIRAARGRDAQDRLAREKCELELQLREAKKLQGLGELAGGISHDLNNLLASVLGYAGLALERAGASDPLLADWLREIERAGLRGRDLLARSIALAREGAGAPNRETPELVVSGRIAVVDDEPGIAALVREALASHGHRVDAFTSSDAALRAIARDRDAYELLVADQTMPGLSGDCLVHEVRRLRPDLPVILATGASDAVDDRVVTGWGHARLLLKPLSLDALRSTAAELIRERGSAAP